MSQAFDHGLAGDRKKAHLAWIDIQHILQRHLAGGEAMGAAALIADDQGAGVVDARGGAGEMIEVMNLSSRTKVLGQIGPDGVVHVGPSS